MKTTPSERYEARVSEAIAELEELLDQHRWEDAAEQVAMIQRTFPNSTQLTGLENQVKMAWRQAKQALEHKFREAARRDDPQKAMDLLRRLDRYLTPADAPAFAEVVQHVIDGLKENLGLRFRMAVNEQDWTAATKTGEQIMREFPNTQMAREVHLKIDVLRERALGQRHVEAAELEAHDRDARRQQRDRQSSEA